MRAAWLAALLALAGLAAACARLPEHALPVGELVDVRTHVPGDAIRYRTLTRHDFLAEEPPPRVAGHAREVGAYTCAEIVPDGPLRAELRRDPQSGGFVAEPVEIGYHALMDRTCSWWNEAQGMPEAYLLQHEQIHFALVELAARELSARARALRARGASPGAALAALERELDAQLALALEELVARSADFDRDTSGRYRPRRQDRWHRRVLQELAETP